MSLQDVEEKVIKSFLANYYAVIKDADYDKSGTIEKKELLSFLMQKGTDYSEAKQAVDNVFNILDKDKNGSIEFEEILKYRKKKRTL